jgi:hypothetical protein
LAAGVDGQERCGKVTSQYCGQRVDVLLRGNTSDEEELGRSVRIEIGRIRGRPGQAYHVVSSLGSRFAVSWILERKEPTKLN